MEFITPSLGVNIKDYDPAILLGEKLWRITDKIDGVRKLFYKSPSGKVTAWSRSGKEDIWLSHICDWLEQPHFPIHHVYDCELVDRESYFAGAESFIMRTETIGKAAQEYMDNKSELMAICFDIFIPEGDMSTGDERTKKLQDIFLGCHLAEPMIEVNIVGYIQGYNELMLSNLMSLVASRKGEGLMLMSMDSPYIPGRSKELVKIKRLEEYVATVIGYELGRDDSKIAGGISSLICEVPGCTVPVRVGTGFSNSLRQDLATDKVIGTKIEIEAFSKTRDKNGDISLSMPVFKQLQGLYEDTDNG
jgi:ATP-dependent DNA ligase